MNDTFIEEKEDNEEIREFTLSVTLPISPVTKKSNPDALSSENIINNIDVFAFDPITKICLFWAKGSDIRDVEGDETQKTFHVTISEGTYDFHIVANVRQEIETLYPAGIKKQDGYTLDSVRENLLSASASAWNIKANPIPLWGGRENVVIDESTDLTGSQGFKLTRMLARIDVYLSKEARKNFKLTSVHLFNYNEYGMIIPAETAGWNSDGYVTYPSIPFGKVVTLGPFDYTGITNDLITGTIYTPDALKGSRAGHLKNTALVVGGEFKGKPNHFYRIDFKRSGLNGSFEYLHILRNHLYEVTIEKVEVDGWDTKEEAFNAIDTDMKAEVMSWENVYYDASIGGQFVFTVSESLISLTPGLYTNYDVLVTATHHDGWKVTESSFPDAIAPCSWITITNRTDNSFRFNVQANNTSTARVGYLHVVAGNLTHIIIIEQAG